MIAPGLIPVSEILLAICADSSTQAGQFRHANAKLFGPAALSLIKHSTEPRVLGRGVPCSYTDCLKSYLDQIATVVAIFFLN